MAWYDELTVAELTTMKENLLAEMNAISIRGQEISTEDLRKRRADLAQIRESLKEICGALNKRSNGGIQAMRIVPVSQ